MSTTEKPDIDVLLDAFRHMTLTDLAMFIKRFEEEFDVSAAVLAAPAVGVAPEGADVAPEEPDEFTVTLTATGPTKIQVIKLVREARKDLGLKEAKELVEQAPGAAVLDGVDKAVAEALAAKLREAGATIEVAPKP